MRSVLAAAALLFGAGCATAPPPPANPPVPVTTPDARATLRDAAAAALHAHAGRAAQLLGTVPEADLGPGDRLFRDCIVARFQADRASELSLVDVPPEVERLLEAFRGYWRQAMTDPARRDDAEQRLLADLRASHGLAEDAPVARLEAVVAQRVAAQGYHVLLGRTPPLRELLIWRKQTERTFEVALPEGHRRMPVMLLDDFVSLGWTDYATCGRHGAGGWATAFVIHAIVPRYRSLDSEEFRVSFLGHEAQHLVDLSAFPAIAPWELEYRAKLVELAMARDTRAKLLDRFVASQGSDASAPHPYANRQVLAELRSRLALPDGARMEDIDPERLRAAAEEALREDTRLRYERTGVLGP